jgi:hypothetical protein
LRLIRRLISVGLPPESRRKNPREGTWKKRVGLRIGVLVLRVVRVLDVLFNYLTDLR